LDIGSSTGGFSEVSIKSGAKLVYAVDVGTNQLHEKLLNNKKIISIENTHFKNLSIDMFKQPIDIVVADISFISLTKLFDKLTTLLNYKYLCVFLIKPQFELSPQEVNSGKVKSKKLLDKAINKIKSYAILNSFKVNGVIPSPILGSKSENKEFLIYMEKQ
jgi:23S rRNA (cytidine1920-2'-O)/16S rRNA (cytidine1409-2'-O)-methyltransferase